MPYTIISHCTGVERQSAVPGDHCIIHISVMDRPDTPPLFICVGDFVRSLNVENHFDPFAAVTCYSDTAFNRLCTVPLHFQI